MKTSIIKIPAEIKYEKKKDQRRQTSFTASLTDEMIKPRGIGRSPVGATPPAVHTLTVSGTVLNALYG